MGEVAQWAEGQPDGLKRSVDGITTARNATCVASSQVDAYAVALGRGFYIGCPWVSPYGESAYFGLRCVDIDAKGRPGATIGQLGLYDVKISYNSGHKTRKALPGGPPVYVVRGALNAERVDVDIHGNPILTTAGQPIGEVTQLQPSEVLQVSWYKPGTPDWKNLRTYRGALNSKAWQGAGTKEVLCHGVNASPQPDSWWLYEADFEWKPPPDLTGSRCYLITGNKTFKLVPSTNVCPWLTQLSNQGSKALDPASGAVVDVNQLNDAQGHPLSPPVMLDLDGSVLSKGAQSIVLLVETIGRTADFGALGI